MYLYSEDGCKKRKLDCAGSSDPDQQNRIGVTGQKLKPADSTVVGINQLHLEAPLPPEWQQCLDLQSGQVYYYNPTTQKKTWEDPRERTHTNSAYSDDHLDCLGAAATSNNTSARLDLELKLPSPLKNCHENDQWMSGKSSTSSLRSSFPLIVGNGGEMVAMACMQCHMLVMVCRASPACPNCKHIHPFHHGSNNQKTDNMPVRETLSLFEYENHGRHQPSK